jgi:hypothetical protein
VSKEMCTWAGEGSIDTAKRFGRPRPEIRCRLFNVATSLVDFRTACRRSANNFAPSPRLISSQLISACRTSNTSIFARTTSTKQPHLSRTDCHCLFSAFDTCRSLFTCTTVRKTACTCSQPARTTPPPFPSTLPAQASSSARPLSTTFWEANKALNFAWSLNSLIARIV